LVKYFRTLVQLLSGL